MELSSESIIQKGIFKFRYSSLVQTSYAIIALLAFITLARFYADTLDIFLIIAATCLYFILVHFFILRKQKIHLTLNLWVLGCIVASTKLMWSVGGMHDEALLGFPIGMVLCGILGHNKTLIFIIIYTVINLIALGLVNDTGLMLIESPVNTLESALLLCLLIILLGVLIKVMSTGLSSLLFSYYEENQLLKLSEQRIHQLSFHDSLTGLPNRLKAGQHFDKYFSEKEYPYLSILFIDLDNFKVVNDSFGHHMGDLLLKEMSHRLRDTISSPARVYRQGGDEFMVLLPSQNYQQVSKIAKELLNTVAEPVAIIGSNHVCTASIGISVGYQERDFIRLCKEADIALYKSKEMGRNVFNIYQENLVPHYEHEVAYIHDLKHALESNEFELYYQPKFNLKSREYVGAEALIRWNHPGRGLVSPDEFIAIAESSGYIVQIGQWVIEESCKQIHAWREEGLDIKSVAINVSPVQFQRTELSEILKVNLQRYSLPSSLIEIEITESVLMDESDLFLTNLSELKEIGVELSIDDFGTGYSNLGYIKNTDARCIKIDKSFILNIRQSQQDKAIVQTIIEMCKALNLNSLAEGVEDELTAKLLLDMGCDSGQGYLWCKPVSNQVFKAYLQSNLDNNKNRLSS